MERYRIPLAVALLALWVLLHGVIEEDDLEDWVDIVLGAIPLALALWALFDRADADRKRA